MYVFICKTATNKQEITNKNYSLSEIRPATDRKLP